MAPGVPGATTVLTCPGGPPKERTEIGKGTDVASPGGRSVGNEAGHSFREREGMAVSSALGLLSKRIALGWAVSCVACGARVAQGVRVNLLGDSHLREVMPAGQTARR